MQAETLEQWQKDASKINLRLEMWVWIPFGVERWHFTYDENRFMLGIMDIGNFKLRVTKNPLKLEHVDEGYRCSCFVKNRKPRKVNSHPTVVWFLLFYCCLTALTLCFKEKVVYNNFCYFCSIIVIAWTFELLSPAVWLLECAAKMDMFPGPKSDFGSRWECISAQKLKRQKCRVVYKANSSLF